MRWFQRGGEPAPVKPPTHARPDGNSETELNVYP